MDGWISNILSVFLFLEIDVNIYFQSILWMLMKQDRFWGILVSELAWYEAPKQDRFDRVLEYSLL